MKYSAVLLAFAGAVMAQSNSSIPTFPCLTETELDAQIPACALECQTSALAAVDCDYEDIACHCANFQAIGDVSEPCLAASTCSSDDINEFLGIIIPVCTYFNLTSAGELPEPVCSVATTSSSSACATSTKYVTSTVWKPTASATGGWGATGTYSGPKATGAAAAIIPGGLMAAVGFVAAMAL